MANERLDLGNVEVDPRMNYRDRAKLMLEQAKRYGGGKRDEGYSDDKCLVSEEGIASLIGAGAQILRMNDEAIDRAFHTHVLYEGHQFFAVTDKHPHPYVIKSQLR